MRKIVQISIVFATILLTSCATHRVEPVVITAPAHLEQRDSWIYLTVTNAEHRYELPWARPPEYAGSVVLETNQVYTFTIVEEPSRIGYVLPEISKVEQDGRMIYDREVCEVHKVVMEHKKVRIVYGFPVLLPGEPPWKTQDQLFPHYRDYTFGGCVTTPDSPKKEPTYVCGRCKQAYAAWKLEHPLVK